MFDRFSESGIFQLMKIKISELKKLVSLSLKKYGYSSKESEIISEILFYAQLRGNNQGIVKLTGKGIPKNPEAKKIEIVKETKLSALLDGHKNMGMLVLKQATEMAIKKAKRHGFGMVGTNNTNTSTGAIGYYANKIAREGLIGFIFAGSPETVTTLGSYEPIFGTNPLAIGIPTKGEPIVLDMATAIMAYYGLIEAKTAGRKIPDGIAYDDKGKFTTDPAKAMDGALLPFDKDRKGAGLALMVEVLTGPLVGASFVGIGDSSNWGNLVWVIDPEILVDTKSFKRNTQKLVERVKSTKKIKGYKEIYVPGEKGNKLTKERIKSGEIDVEVNLLNQLKEIASK